MSDEHMHMTTVEPEPEPTHPPIRLSIVYDDGTSIEVEVEGYGIGQPTGWLQLNFGDRFEFKIMDGIQKIIHWR